jgi:glycerophosphoryl diester phosphodiesterase
MRRLFKIVFVVSIFIFSDVALSLTVYGHRGARGLAPENTIPAYAVALKAGVDYVDLDVALTRDGVIVVQHDLTLNPDITRDASGKWIKDNQLVVKNLTLKQLKMYDVGQIKSQSNYAKLFSIQHPVPKTSIPTLREVIQYVKQHEGKKRVGFQIEIKTDPSQPNLSPTPQAIVNALDRVLREEHIVNRTKVQAYDWRCLQLLQKINHSIRTAYITDVEQEKQMRSADPKIAGLWTAGFLLKNYHDSIPVMIKALGGRDWDVEDKAITAEKVREAHQLGLKVNVWFNPEAQGKDVDLVLIKKMMMMHVDGIITDRPDVVIDLIHTYQKMRTVYV